MYKIKNIDYENTTYLNDDVIYYHKILYNRYMDRLNVLLIKYNYNFYLPKESVYYNIDKFNVEDRDNILFNLGGVLNHELYFDNIDTNVGNVENNKFLDRIILKYGSFFNFKNIFKKEASYLVGSGYTFLVLDNNNNFKIINLPNQKLPISLGFKPLIALDLWEHVYYLQYNVNKIEYIDLFLDNLNLSNINKRYIDILSKRCFFKTKK